MVKKAIIIIQLVPESEDIDDEQLKKEIMESLSCDWILKVEEVTIKRSTKGCAKN